MLHLGSGAVLECACGTGGTAHLGTRHGVGCAQTSISGRGEHLGEQGAAPRRVTSRSDGFVMVLYDILTALATSEGATDGVWDERHVWRMSHGRRSRRLVRAREASHRGERRAGRRAGVAYMDG